MLHSSQLSLQRGLAFIQIHTLQHRKHKRSLTTAVAGRGEGIHNEDLPTSVNLSNHRHKIDPLHSATQ